MKLISFYDVYFSDNSFGDLPFVKRSNKKMSKSHIPTLESICWKGKQETALKWVISETQTLTTLRQWVKQKVENNIPLTTYNWFVVKQILTLLDKIVLMRQAEESDCLVWSQSHLLLAMVTG